MPGSDEPEVDELGYPVNTEMRLLYNQLLNLAAYWREMNVRENLKKREEIAQQYEKVMRQLFSLNWDGHLDVEGELPDEFMPQEYFEFWDTRNASIV